jgi:glycerophosphoryl diester phosphodiesterase
LSNKRPNHPFLKIAKPLVIAHRGGQGLWPPNTLYAFKRAAKMGVDILELDIHTSADGVLVVRHDPTVDATTNGSGAIASFSLSEVKALDAGYRWSADGGRTFPYRDQGISIPTLAEVFSAFPDIGINIDIKTQDPAVVAPFVDLLRRFERTNNVMVGSFHDDQLLRFRRLCPEAATAAGVGETRLLFVLNLLRLGRLYRPTANAFQIPEYSGQLHIVTPGFVRSAHAKDVEVHIWTVNETADMRRLLDWGVDGIITDFPNRLFKLIKRSFNPQPQNYD